MNSMMKWDWQKNKVALRGNMKFGKYIKVKNFEEARKILEDDKNPVVLGGTTFLRLGGQEYSTAIDLSELGLKYIRETGGTIEIGAMATLRDIEVSRTTSKHFGTFLEDAVRHIIGVQFRNCATVGGAVCGRFGFSELITAFSVLDCDLEFDRAGRIPFDDFISGKKLKKDILKSVFIRINNGKYSYKSQRNSDADFPVIAVAASLEDELKIAVGARPGIAKLSKEGVKHLSTDMDRGIKLIKGEFSFGTDIRAGADYRKRVCGVLARRAVAEVLQ